MQSAFGVETSHDMLAKQVPLQDLAIHSREDPQYGEEQPGSDGNPVLDDSPDTAA